MVGPWNKSHRIIRLCTCEMKRRIQSMLYTSIGGKILWAYIHVIGVIYKSIKVKWFFKKSHAKWSTVVAINQFGTLPFRLVDTYSLHYRGGKIDELESMQKKVGLLRFNFNLNHSSDRWWDFIIKKPFFALVPIQGEPMTGRGPPLLVTADEGTHPALVIRRHVHHVRVQAAAVPIHTILVARSPIN